ncbi:exodeoxyribonuclease VII small subunit [Rhodobacteraceae bacterium SC52]|nr:exodeoxyribonuclease VII small subunit [Rhodobacteraceae bacterium SC52]
MSDTPDTPVEDMTFEAAMAELETVVGRLEAGEVALDESISLYERGALLKAHCEARLKSAEEKVATITLDETGQPKGTVSTDAT